MKRWIAVVAVSLFATPSFAETRQVLLPIYSPPVFGAFNSQFVTELYVGNRGATPVTVRNLAVSCQIICIPPIFPEEPYVLQPGDQLKPPDLVPTGNPGRFLILEGDDVDAIAMNLRVRDVADTALDYGTEIPVVRASDFRINEIVFLGVPSDSRFRNTLRIYAREEVDVIITAETVGHDPVPVRVRLKGLTDLLDPAYGVFTNFPRDIGEMEVRIVADPDFVSLLPIEIPLWAFISVTNNTTNAISVISPQP